MNRFFSRVPRYAIPPPPLLKLLPPSLQDSPITVKRTRGEEDPFWPPESLRLQK